MQRRTPIAAHNVGTIQLPNRATEPVPFQQATSGQRRAIYMAAFGYTAKKIWQFVGPKAGREGDADTSKPWVEIIVQPKRRPKWVTEAIDWIQSRIEDNQFLSENLFDNYDDLLREISTLYLREYKNDDVDSCRRLLELSAKILKSRDGTRDGSSPTNQVVVFNGESPERNALFSRIEGFGSPIPGGPHLALDRDKREAVDAPRLSEYGVDGVDVHPTEDRELGG